MFSDHDHRSRWPANKTRHRQERLASTQVKKPKDSCSPFRKAAFLLAYPDDGFKHSHSCCGVWTDIYRNLGLSIANGSNRIKRLSFQKHGCSGNMPIHPIQNRWSEIAAAGQRDALRGVGLHACNIETSSDFNQGFGATEIRLTQYNVRRIRYGTCDGE